MQQMNILKKEKQLQELENYNKNSINWMEDDFYNNWDKIKGHSKKLWGHKTSICEKENYPETKLFFLAHSQDTIVGKPQLIENTQKKIPLVREAVRTIKKTEDGDKCPPTDIISYYFFDEKFDKRHDGFQRKCLALDFWLYKVVTEQGKEYYIFSEEQLPNCTCEFKGMLVEIDDFAEVSRSMRIKSLSRVFFLKSYEPNVKILSPDALINFTKTRGVDEKKWLDFLAYHPFKTQNRFPTESEMLKSAWLLSGKLDGYPLHLHIMGPQGTRKSKGYIECSASKFGPNHLIIEGGNSRLKGLVPSFKERPANLGYLAKAERVGFIDELGKMIEQRMFQDNLSSSNLLGEANFLLDHSLRLVGSGNDNDILVQATGKFMFASNPISNRNSIYSHVGVYDPTFMSRILWWVQDEAEQEFVLSDGGIVRCSDNTITSPIDIKINKKYNLLKLCYRKYIVEYIDYDEFLSLFDTCYSLVSTLEQAKIKELADKITLLAREPMKSVWKPRAEHHVGLLVDGLCKHRCLFKDYDPSFVSKREDYEMAERILIRMVNAWDTDLSPKEAI